MLSYVEAAMYCIYGACVCAGGYEAPAASPQAGGGTHDFKITLGRAPRPPAPAPAPPSVTSTNPKTPSPSLNVSTSFGS